MNLPGLTLITWASSFTGSRRTLCSGIGDQLAVQDPADQPSLGENFPESKDLGEGTSSMSISPSSPVAGPSGTGKPKKTSRPKANKSLNIRYTGRYCVAHGCNSQQGRDQVSFFRFPRRNKDRFDAWVRATRWNRRDSSWNPNFRDHLCSKHFVTGKPSTIENNPDYVPSIFATGLVRKKSKADIARADRALKRLVKSSAPLTVPEDDEDVDVLDEPNVLEKEPSTSVSLDSDTSKMEVKTRSSSIQTDPQVYRATLRFTDEKTCKEVNGVPYPLFLQITKISRGLADSSRALHLSEKVALYLMTLRHALPFTLTAAMFDISPVLASRTFHEVLDQHHAFAKKWVYWISREDVDATMPKTCKLLFPQTRVIVDGSEIRTEKPSDIEAAVHEYSSYKGGFTAKFLIGIAPSGLITFLSDCYGGRATDSNMVVGSGLLKLLQSNDLILADKGFPSVREHALNRGCYLVMPPFKKGDNQFTEEENIGGHNITTIREKQPWFEQMLKETGRAFAMGWDP